MNMMSTEQPGVVSVEWVDGKMRFIDQTRLPFEEVYVETSDHRVVGEAIRKLQIRGAPAIGVAGAFAMVLALREKQAADRDALRRTFTVAHEYLSATRPTAVNLLWALNRVRRRFDGCLTSGVEAAINAVLAEALEIQRKDREACRRIAGYGSELIEPGSSILTHCNTGALATAGEGTAQGIIAMAARQGKIRRVYVDETRPLLQGARLTTWELSRLGIDTILVTDSTAGVLMKQRKVEVVVVGADRIAANGDTANKIGTYGLAVLAYHHQVPFFVAAPLSTIDIDTASGDDIPIEERGAEEIICVHNVRIAPEGIGTYAPAFDTTPNKFVTAIVTEAGILRPPYSESIAAAKRGAAKGAGREQ